MTNQNGIKPLPIGAAFSFGIEKIETGQALAPRRLLHRCRGGGEAGWLAF
jgi:hypothetical protein